ncbi:HNH endonuclease [Burkholderia sp. WP9]|uniref:HNH endonuclease n=1 Tax=Burkholderia sp. WP9 TaxID=1500263 RepID=UPI000895026F|nr:HNH endonuclease signature motif containing protein [Burkholderia sp. WP9]SED73077.1 HNH endonuclease [Burkholderia sp. WP9]
MVEERLQKNRWNDSLVRLGGQRQRKTEIFLEWLADRAAVNNGVIEPFTNAERFEAMGYQKNAGMAAGTVQSRVDFACFKLGLPPLGLTSQTPYSAWEYDGKASWAFPLAAMVKAARERQWTPEEFKRILATTQELPEVARLWVSPEMEAQRRQWAALFGSTVPGEGAAVAEPAKKERNQAWMTEANAARESPQDLIEANARRLIEDLRELERDVPDVTERDQLAKARIGQGRFRADVIAKWGRGEVCALTGAAIPEMLVASHIKPWRKSSNEERLDPMNGLLLAANVDRLFDRNLMSFKHSRGEYFSVLHPRLRAEAGELGLFEGMRLSTSHLGFSGAQRFERYMSEHLRAYLELV